jgi:hypothetical protein
MYENIIKKWEHDKKVLFISGSKKGCGKKYISDSIAKKYEIIKCKPSELIDNDNIGIQCMFGSIKKKIIIFYLSDIIIYNLKYDNNIKIIVIIDDLILNNRLTKFMKKHYHIHINLTDIQYINILKQYITINQENYLKLLVNYDYDLNAILNNFSNLEKISDLFFHDSLLYLNNKHIEKFNIKDYFIVGGEYSLMGLHLLDHDKNINVNLKENIYQSIIYSEKTKICNGLYNYTILNSLIIPHKIIIKNNNNIKNIKNDKIKYTKYISKSLIYINMLNTNYDVNPDDIYTIIETYNNDKNETEFINNIEQYNLTKKKLKYFIKLHDLIHKKNNIHLLKLF